VRLKSSLELALWPSLELVPLLRPRFSRYMRCASKPTSTGGTSSSEKQSPWPVAKTALAGRDPCAPAWPPEPRRPCPRGRQTGPGTADRSGTELPRAMWPVARPSHPGPSPSPREAVGLRFDVHICSSIKVVLTQGQPLAGACRSNRRQKISTTKGGSDATCPLASLLHSASHFLDVHIYICERTNSPRGITLA
jgi:hypothetical protein